ncbi:hypothetical protein HRbin27_01882 [bacterium HR27]|nr:hypothetical protein HRbin27_01882 [bacterium HR27]
MLVGGVVEDQLGNDPDPASVRLADEFLHVSQRHVGWMNVGVVRDIVAIVAQR